MDYDQKREMRRRVRSSMLPSPTWNHWDAIPTCRPSCMLFVDGKCAWNKITMAAGQPCVPVITVCIERLGKLGEKS